MKKIKLFSATLALMAVSQFANAQLTFGVAPGLMLSSSKLGYRFGNFEPMIGFQFLRGTYSSEESGKRDNGNGVLENYTETAEAMAGVYLPSLGVKAFLKPVGTIQSYFKLNLIKPILAAKSVNDGIEDTDLKDDLKDISLFGTQLGFGVEHFFSKHFSVGGEFGLTYFSIKTKNTTDSQVYNPQSGTMENTQTTRKANVVINPTYAVFSFNYYFSKRIPTGTPNVPE